MTADVKVKVTADGDPWASNVTWTSQGTDYRFGKQPSMARGVISVAAMAGGSLIDYGQDRSSANYLSMDGAWHSVEANTISHKIDLSRASTLGLWFDAGMMGSSSKCHSDQNWDASKQVSGAHKDGTLSVDYDQPLAFCSIGNGGGVCSIASTKSSESSVDVGIAAEFYGWLTGSLSKTWTHSASVEVQCTSPELPANSKYFAYAAGYTYNYDVSVNFFGNDLGTKRGTAFEVVHNGLHCELAA